jgi:hypothetical protein
MSTLYQDTTSGALVAEYNPTYQSQFQVLHDEVFALDQ